MSIDTRTGEIIDALSDAEYADLERLETVVSKGLTSFVEVGSALAEIRDRRLYRDTHQTFALYCEQQWELGKSQAYRLIDAAEVVAEMSPIGDTPIPTTESQARVLKDVAPDERAAVMDEASKDGPPTAKKIREVIEQRTERETVEPQFKDPTPDLIDEKRENDPEIHAAHVTGRYSDALTAFLNIARKLDPADVAQNVTHGRDGQRIERLTTELENWLNAYRDAPNLRRVK